jgi:hypothetical protein
MAELIRIKLKRVLEISFLSSVGLPCLGNLETIQRTAKSLGILILKFVLWKRMQILNKALCFCSQSGEGASSMLTKQLQSRD